MPARIKYARLLTALFVTLATGHVRADLPAQVEARINHLIGQMTLAEKVAVCLGAGAGGPNVKGVSRLNLPDMVATDGPFGPHHGTAFPCGVAFGATWNTELMEQAATVNVP